MLLISFVADLSLNKHIARSHQTNGRLARLAMTHQSGHKRTIKVTLCHNTTLAFPDYGGNLDYPALL
jgi:hypothetical protein